MREKTMHLRMVSACMALSFCMLAGVSAYSQVDTGGVRGTVKDASGAGFSGAKVRLTNEDTTLSTETLTSDRVKIGTDTIEVQMSGFSKGTRRHVSVEVQQQVKADFLLNPGSVAQSVEATAVAPLLQTQHASVRALASRVQINNLTLNGRNYLFLVQLGSGVSSLKGTRGLDGSGSFVANCLTTVHNNYILEGIDNNNDTVDS